MVSGIDIPKEKLEQMYWRDGMSMNKICEIFGFSHHMVISRLMDRYCLSRRTRKESQSLCNLPIYVNPDFFKTDDFGYLVGVADGDGHVRYNQFELNVKDFDFANNFYYVLMRNGFDISMPKKSRNNDSFLWRVRVCRKVLCEKLMSIGFDDLTLKQRLKYVNGFFDSEGTVNYNPKRWSKSITVSNTKLKFIKNIACLFDSLDISYGIYKRSVVVHPNSVVKKFNAPFMFTLSVHRNDMILKFYKHFKFSIKRKQDRLEKIVASYKS